MIYSNNALNGDIVVNDNAGILWLLDPIKNTSVAIASGGTRGDYVSPDTNNGTLLLDFSDTIERLDCGPDCGFRPPPPPTGTPEPASMGLASASFTGLSLLYWRRRRR